MKNCPVCELELPDVPPPFCPRCAWDLKSDPTLNVVLGDIPDEMVEEYRQRRSVARANWEQRLRDERERRELREEIERLKEKTASPVREVERPESPREVPEAPETTTSGPSDQAGRPPRRGRPKAVLAILLVVGFFAWWIMKGDSRDELATKAAPESPQEDRGALGDTWKEPVTGMELAWIPGGCFEMGSPPYEDGRDEDEGPVHEVCLDGFWMGKYEVTQDQWREIMGGNPSRFKEGDRFPVENVSWNDAKAFLQKLSSRNNGRYTFRLPAEAEWEYACRAGTSTPFHFGETITTDQANYDGNQTYGSGRKGVYRRKTTPVGSFPPNAFGLHDMHGNVWEWCEDWFDGGYYQRSPRNNPHGPDGGRVKVLRGGSWLDIPSRLRCACRYRRNPDNRFSNWGFRVARVGVAR